MKVTENEKDTHNPFESVDNLIKAFNAQSKTHHYIKRRNYNCSLAAVVPSSIISARFYFDSLLGFFEVDFYFASYSYKI